jgi:negative regulator of sigma E activity
MTRKLLPLLIVLTVVPAVARGMTAADIVCRAYDADRHVSYRGVKSTLVRTNQTDTRATIKVVHLAPDKMRKEYFAPASLAGTVVVQNGRQVWKCDPYDPVWEVASSDRYGPGRSANCTTALRNYDVKLLGSERVAGRDAYVIRATQKSGSEPRRTIWVDKSCYLVLKTRAESREGVLRSSSGFTSITIDPGDISSGIFAVAGKVESFAAPAGFEFSLQKPSYLPKGYRMIGIAKETANGHPCAHLQFSNGVNTISLFERKCAEIARAPHVPKKLTTVVTWVRDGVLFTLIGEVGSAELKKVADSTK